MQFELKPFAPCPKVHRITGDFRPGSGEITCEWQLAGDIDGIRWPAADGECGRRMGLWEHTCFEFFIGRAGSSVYYEFNLSPAGHWNSFGFSDLRSGMHETDLLVCRHSSLQYEAGIVTISAALDARLASREIIETRARVGISAVIEDSHGQRHYFALAHASGRPDFHLPDNHLLTTGPDR